jgi:hypothetical protein
VTVGKSKQETAATQAGQKGLGNRGRAQRPQNRIEGIAPGFKDVDRCLCNFRAAGCGNAYMFSQESRLNSIFPKDNTGVLRRKHCSEGVLHL